MWRTWTGRLTSATSRKRSDEHAPRRCAARDLGITYVGADDIAARLNPADPAAARVAAGRAFFAEVERLTAARASFVCESTLSGRGFVGTMQRLRDAGFSVAIAFVFLDDAEVCLARVAERVRRGGHPVPDADVVRRFDRSRSNFWSLYRPLCDAWTLDYNGIDGFRRVAAGTRDPLGVYDDDLFRLFYDGIDPDD